MTGKPAVAGRPGGARVRVFHLIKGLGRGGAERLLVETLDLQDRQRFSFGYGYFLPWKNALVPELRRRGASVRLFRAGSAAGILLQVPGLARYLRRWQADLLHCHLPLAAVAGRLAAALAGVPVVYTEHNLQHRYHPLTRWANRATWRLQDAVVAVSAGVAAAIGGGPTPVHLIVNGIDAGRFRRHDRERGWAREQLGIPARALVVGTVAGLRRQKRLDLWLEAAAALGGAGREVRFLLVGDGPERAELEALARRLGLGEVSFAGLQADVRPFLAAMDLFMISSDSEGLPLALLEAMAMELPVVATAVGGIPEVLREGVTGYLAPPAEPGRLAAAARPLLEDRRLRERMGRAGRRRVEARFSATASARALERLYLRVLEERGRGPHAAA